MTGTGRSGRRGRRREEPPSRRAPASEAPRPAASRHVVTVASVGTRAAIGAARVHALVLAVLRAERADRSQVSVTFLPPRAMATLNRRHLGHAGPTDVISFAFAPGPSGLVGDVYVCPDVARVNAARFGCGVREETARLVVHGTLHILGWDHPIGPGRERSPMWRRQEALLRRQEALLRRQEALVRRTAAMAAP